MLLVVATFLTALGAPAAESGLQPGDAVPAFQVNDVTGPNKGQQLCYV